MKYTHLTNLELINESDKISYDISDLLEIFNEIKNRFEKIIYGGEQLNLFKD